MSAHVAIPAYGSVHANIISDHFTKPEWAKSVAEYYSTARPDDRILAVFCDGGTSTRHGGYTSYAVCWRDPDTQEWHETGGLLANNPSSNAAEVFAVARALETAADILDEYEGRFTTVKVFTDYQGVLTKLKELRTSPSATYGWRKEYFEAVLRHEGRLAVMAPLVEVDMHWVPGHRGVEGNVRADRVAGRLLDEHDRRLQAEERKRREQAFLDEMERAELEEKLRAFGHYDSWYVCRQSHRLRTTK